MLHRDFRSILDLVDGQSIKLSNSRGSHRAGAADLRLASAFGTGDTRICTNHVTDQAGHSERIQDLLLRKSAVFVHIIENGRQNSAAPARRRCDYHILSRIFLTDRVRVSRNHAVHRNVGALVIAASRNHAVHRNVGALVIAALSVKIFSLPCEIQTAGQYAVGGKSALDRLLHGLPDLPQIIAECITLQYVNQLKDTDFLLIAQGYDLRKVFLRINFPVLLGGFIFDANRSTADTEYPRRGNLFPSLERFEKHRIRMRQIFLSGLAVKYDFRSGKPAQYRFSRAVSLTGESKRSVKRDLIGIRIRITAAEA